MGFEIDTADLINEPLYLKQENEDELLYLINLLEKAISIRQTTINNLRSSLLSLDLNPTAGFET